MVGAFLRGRERAILLLLPAGVFSPAEAYGVAHVISLLDRKDEFYQVAPHDCRLSILGVIADIGKFGVNGRSHWTRALLLRCLPLCYLMAVLLLSGQGSSADEMSFMAIKARYFPHAESSVGIEALASTRIQAVRSWWQPPSTVSQENRKLEHALRGLHIALDPGHIGGDWSEIEGRHFRINQTDYAVREGDLVLEVARMVCRELESMGARVSLLRETAEPVNPRLPADYLPAALEQVSGPHELTCTGMAAHAIALRRRMNHLSIISGEISERARLVNEVIRPDALISLHINAAPWPVDAEGGLRFELVDSNHVHVLIFGCMSDTELNISSQREQMLVKMRNGSSAIELALGQAIGEALGRATGLVASEYNGSNAVRLEGSSPYLWVRNLSMLRQVECPVVLLEPYIANSREAYPRIQQALKHRHYNRPVAEDDILVEYADAVVAGIMKVYAPGLMERR